MKVDAILYLLRSRFDSSRFSSPINFICKDLCFETALPTVDFCWLEDEYFHQSEGRARPSTSESSLHVPLTIHPLHFLEDFLAVFEVNSWRFTQLPSDELPCIL